jgi:DNA-binding MarR family transcriptional regulator
VTAANPRLGAQAKAQGTEASRSRARAPENGHALPTVPSAVTPPFQSVGFAVSSLGYAVARRFRATLAPLELEPREFAILRALDAAEGLSQQAAAERLQIPPSRMVAFVDLLEGRGLLERKPRPEDRRSWALHLTAAGRELLGRAFQLAAALENELCADLGERDRARLLEMLWRVGARLGLAPGTHAAHKHAALLDDSEGPCAEG